MSLQPQEIPPGPKTPPANSPSGRKPTTRRSRRRGNGSRPPRSKPSMPSGPGAVSGMSQDASAAPTHGRGPQCRPVGWVVAGAGTQVRAMFEGVVLAEVTTAAMAGGTAT